MVRLLHMGYDQVIVLETHHGSRWSRLFGTHSWEFATSRHDLLSPPRMNMWYNSGCAAGPEVVFDTSALSLSTCRTRIPAGTTNCRL
jgi:hypothetical protein